MTGRHAPALAAALLAAGLTPCAASALTVRLMSGSAIGMKSTFEKAEAPRSTFEKAGPDSELQSVFVSSEVAPERVETTRTLLSELNARRSDGVIVIDLPADVLFDFDKATIRPDAEPALARAAELLKSYPRAQVSIGGHTDAKGDDAYNEGLSLRRARAVADRLQGPAGRSLKAEGFGRASARGAQRQAGRGRRTRRAVRRTGASKSASPRRRGADHGADPLSRLRASVSEAAVACPNCGHPIAGDNGGTFKQALTRPEAVKSGFTVLGVFVAAPWIARILALILFVVLAIVVVVNKS